MNFRPILAVILFSIVISSAESQSTKLTAHFFGSATCGECNQIKENMLKPLVAQNEEKFEYTFHDIDTDSGLTTLLAFEKQFSVKTSSPQELFLPDTYLTGFEDIMKYGKEMITSRIASGNYGTIQIDSSAGNLTEVLRKKAASWGFLLGTTGAGLVDGINPCAIATMIFLISFMTTRKRKPKEILTIGLVYSATVFITYFSMGAGLKSILEGVKQYHTISLGIRWTAAGAAVLIALLSFKDAFSFKKTKNTDSITLQLPKQVKLRIHKIISGNLSGRSLVVGAIITGFLVTLLEAICTGQMYVPFIVAMTSDSSLKTTGYLYLAYYNFLFILPLLIVMVLAYYGMKWNELAKQTQNNMVKIKIGIGIVMLGLALYLINGIL